MRASYWKRNFNTHPNTFNLDPCLNHMCWTCQQTVWFVPISHINSQAGLKIGCARLWGTYQGFYGKHIVCPYGWWRGQLVERRTLPPARSRDKWPARVLDPGLRTAQGHGELSGTFAEDDYWWTLERREEEEREPEGKRRLPDKADFFLVQMLLAEERGGSSMFSYISQG